MGRRAHFRLWGVAAGLLLGALVMPSVLSAANEPTVEELKSRVANTILVDRPPLCLRIAEKQLDAADKFYLAGENDKAQAALTDVIAFSELARDYSIQSRKHEKQAEIAVRKMARKLADIKHTVSREDQDQLQEAIDRLQRIRDDLLQAMFPNGGKK
jgi:hypothetical protein